ncbi:MAG: hypothetical protein O2780_09365 [Proteobacteria bacterium]|nr:hypothetical protein [Pseudomonadota bacterium]
MRTWSYTSPRLPPLQFRYHEDELSPATLNTTLQQEALATALLPGYLCREQLYSLYTLPRHSDLALGG